MKWVILLAVLLLFLPLGFGDVIHTVDLGSNHYTLTTELILETDNRVDVWTLSWSIPDGGELISIEDESGPVEYTQIGDEIEFKTNPDVDKNREDVKIISRVTNPYNNKYSPFRQLSFSFPGFNDEKTTITINGDIITTSIPIGFNVNQDGSRLRMQGKGPAAMFAYAGSVNLREFYYASGGSPSEAEDNYNIIPGTIGIVPYYVTFPVLYLNDREYEQVANPYSAGTYKTGGIILIKEDAETSEEHIGGSDAATLIHETTHAYNDQIMNWKDVDASWFDEGTAQYIEFLFRIKNNEIFPEIFGEPVELESGLFSRTVYPSRGDADDLWDYYQDGETWMEEWSPSTANAERRRFGYAFSELMIRKYIIDNGSDGLHNVYVELSQIDHKVDDTDEFNRIVLDIMKTRLAPCKTSDRTSFDNCLKQVNNFRPNIIEFTGDVKTAKRNDAINSAESFRDIETAQEEGLVRKTNIIDRIIFFIQDFFLRLREGL